MLGLIYSKSNITILKLIYFDIKTISNKKKTIKFQVCKINLIKFSIK